MSHGLSLLSPLRSDLITLQECRRPAIDSASVIWRGTDPRQGVAVVSTEAAARLEFVEIPKLHPTVVPVRVQATQPFVFVGVWTHPPYNAVAWAAMTAYVAAADGLPVVAAGDFNSSPGVQGQQRDAQRFLQRMRHPRRSSRGPRPMDPARGMENASAQSGHARAGGSRFPPLFGRRERRPQAPQAFIPLRARAPQRVG